MYRYIGKPLKRIEDLPLLRGRGRFIDDLKFPGMLEAAFVRSPHGHALIRGVDTLEARNSRASMRSSPSRTLRRFFPRSGCLCNFAPHSFRPTLHPSSSPRTKSRLSAKPWRSSSPTLATSPRTRLPWSRSTMTRCRPYPTAARRLRRNPVCAHRGRSGNLIFEFSQAYGDVDAGIFACAASRQRQSEATPRWRPFHRGPRCARRLRRERRSSHAVVVDPACSRGAGVSNGDVAARRKSSARRRPRCRRRLRCQVRHVSGRSRRSRCVPASCAARSNGSRTVASIFFRRSRSATSIGTLMWPSMTTAGSSGCAAA